MSVERTELEQHPRTIARRKLLECDALELSDRAYVLEQGSVALTGTGAELLGNPHVKQAYLGA